MLTSLARDSCPWTYLICPPSLEGKHFLPLTETGLRDSNSARRSITERYLLKCDKIFAVCNISRAVTDEGVEEVFNRAKQEGLSNVSMTCTKAD